MDQEITIDETGPDFFLASLEHYLESAEFSDVVLISREGDQMPAHRAVLSSVSRFLRDIFVEDSPQEAAGETTIHLHLPETSTRDLYAFLQLAYCGNIELSVQRRSSLMSLLLMLKVAEDIVVVGEATGAEAATKPTGLRNPLLGGSCSLIKVTGQQDGSTGGRRSNSHGAGNGVTVEFLQTKAPCVDDGPPPAKLPRISSPFVSGTMGPLRHEGLMENKAEADQRTREVLDVFSTGGADPSRKPERCQCPNCFAGGGGGGSGSWTSLHVCHYADCGKKYKKTSHLRAHLRWHIGDQPFVCSWENCGKRFTRSDELHRHFRIHTGEKNHKCNICGKRFSRSDHLKKHVMSHAAGFVSVV